MAPGCLTESPPQAETPIPRVERCGEGHALQLWVAQTGRCQGCNRWVFGSEMVMGCAVCNCYYCPTCAPQARNSSEDHVWYEILSTIGSALRDAERIKGQISSQVHTDIGRIRSAFNCQNPESATLSAEQIVVEHAVQQARSALSCAGPDDSELHAHEIEVGRDPIGVDPAPAGPQQERTHAARPTQLTSVSEVQTKDQTDILSLSDGLVREKTDLLDVNSQSQGLLDLSDSAPTGGVDMLLAPTAAAVQEYAVSIPDNQQTNLLVIHDTEICKDVQGQMNLPMEPNSSAVQEELAGVPGEKHVNLLDISDAPLTLQDPAPAQAVNNLDDLIDFGEPAVPSPNVKDVEEHILRSLDS